MNWLKMIHLMGIDGGGSTVRVCITDNDLNIIGQATGGSVNPNTVGYAAAAATIQAVMRAAIEESGLAPEHITGAGIGVAGAPDFLARDWLMQTVAGVLPQTRVFPGSDNEIALVGALGARYGILILSGTGSVSHGINQAGESIQVGGWGYLLGDEGSGYWLGLEALKAVTRQADGRGDVTCLTESLLQHLNLSAAWDIIGWVYGLPAPHTRTVAGLARLVLEAAASGDVVAGTIIERGAVALAEHVFSLQRRLDMPTPPIAFAGGLLEGRNPLSLRLAGLLGLPDVPAALYPPVIGAALLAKLGLQKTP